MYNYPLNFNGSNCFNDYWTLYHNNCMSAGYSNPYTLTSPQIVYQPQNPKVDTLTSKTVKTTQPVKQPEKKKKNNTALWIIGTIGAVALAAVCLSKGKVAQAKQLAKSIKFKPAKTVEEAIEFGQKNLGINTYKGFEKGDINAINYINNGLTQTANKMEGKLIMPNTVEYKAFEEGSNYTAYYNRFKNKITFNKNDFNNPSKELKDIVDEIVNESGSINHIKRIGLDSNMKALYLKCSEYKFNPNLFTYDEKMGLIESLRNYINYYLSMENSPYKFINAILSDTERLNLLKSANIKTDINAIRSMDTPAQEELLEKMFEAFEKSGHPLEFCPKTGFINASPYQTVFHEMGHANDLVKRCAASGKYSKSSQYPKELVNWLENKEYQQIANSVSSYASTGPGEFIAETFAELISGHKLPQQTIDLYKKLGGPAVAGI